MSKQSESVKRWRERTKQRMVDSMGGRCACCGYNKCNDALEFHHLDPSKKKFGMGGARGSIVSWKRLVEELRKCVMVCSNCHSEIHDGMTIVSEDAPIFDEGYADYKDQERDANKEPCPICGTLKSKRYITCSVVCGAKRKGKVNWDSVDLEVLIKEQTVVKIAADLGVSDVSVHKRLKKLGLKK